MKVKVLMLQAAVSLGIGLGALTLTAPTANAKTFCTEPIEEQCGNFHDCPDPEDFTCDCPGYHPIAWSCNAGSCPEGFMNASWLCELG